MGGITTDIRTGLAFCTRLPLPFGAGPAEASLAQAVWTFPVIGAGIGALGALVYWLGYGAGTSSFVAATLAVTATALITGCLHEDGLADTADGFGGGATKERKLEIMRDSRSGAYGVMALLLSILLRVGAIASLVDPGLAAAALIAAHAGARAAVPVFMAAVPRARQDGLSASAGTPPQGSVLTAVLLGLLALLLCLGFGVALVATLLVGAGLWLMARLSLKQIGGQTGDVLGAVEQLSEILILLAASALL
jgi:adenosylcobinamide-GDP ribazoletransferase